MNLNARNLGKRWLPVLFLAMISALVIVGLVFSNSAKAPEPASLAIPSPVPAASPGGSPSPAASPSLSNASASPAPLPSIAAAPSGISGKADLAVDANGYSHASVVITTAKGIIRFKLYTNDAPNTVSRFVQLVDNGFYNGLTFHSVKPDFVVQGGDPLGTGRGGSGTRLKAEFNSRHHIEGTVAMARTSDPNSADSQFYIALRPLPQLDGNYTVFGQVIDGLDVLHKLQPGDKMLSVRIE